MPLLLPLALLAGCTAGAPAPERPAQPSTQPPSGGPEQIPALLARPLAVPSVPPGGSCPISGPAAGPLYPHSAYLGTRVAQIRDRTPSPDGFIELKVVWASSADRYRGPAVVRAARIDGPGRARVRLYYDPGALRGDATVFTLDVDGDWPAATDVTGPGCYAYQIDGTTFTEVIVFQVVP